jgi:hypothetical protein
VTTEEGGRAEVRVSRAAAASSCEASGCRSFDGRDRPAVRPGPSDFLYREDECYVHNNKVHHNNKVKRQKTQKHHNVITPLHPSMDESFPSKQKYQLHRQQLVHTIQDVHSCLRIMFFLYILSKIIVSGYTPFSRQTSRNLASSSSISQSFDAVLNFVPGWFAAAAALLCMSAFTLKRSSWTSSK